MISTRPFYSSEHELYRRPEHDMSMALPHASPASDHYEAIGQMSRQDSPPVDGQSKSQAARKRVPVACDRCRKRKIKCSGSEGQGSACTNCLNAGYPNCQFLRVASIALTHQSHPRVWHGGHRFSPYPIPSTSRQQFIPIPQTYAYSPLHNGIEFHPFQTPTQSLSWTRGSYGAAYPSGYEDTQSPQFSTQPPAYMLPSTDPMATANACYLQPQFGRSHNSTLWSESLGSLPSSNSQLINTMYPLASNNSPTSFAIHSTQPIISSERTLPNPSSSTRGLPLGMAPPREIMPSSAVSHRSSNSWQTDALSSSSAVSSRTSCSASQDNGSHKADDSNASGTSTTTDMGFGYIGVSSSPETESMPAPAATQAAGSFSKETQSTEDQDRRSSVDFATLLQLEGQFPNRPKRLSQEQTAFSPNTTSQGLPGQSTLHYPHNTVYGSRDRRSIFCGYGVKPATSPAHPTLVNGLEYTRPPIQEHVHRPRVYRQNYQSTEAQNQDPDTARRQSVSDAPSY